MGGFVFRMAAAFAGVAGAQASDAVLHLGESSFDQKVLKSGKGTLVKFFAPWCGHCKALRPIWDQLAEELKSDSSVQIADVDCTKEQSVCDQYDVKGYPSLKFLAPASGVKLQDYSGLRDKDSLLKFVKAQLAVACQVKDQTKCTQKQKEYITKQQPKTLAVNQKELSRLQSLADGKMAAGTKDWMLQRITLLEQLVDTTGEEL